MITDPIQELRMEILKKAAENQERVAKTWTAEVSTDGKVNTRELCVYAMQQVATAVMAVQAIHWAISASHRKDVGETIQMVYSVVDSINTDVASFIMANSDAMIEATSGQVQAILDKIKADSGVTKH